MRACAVFWFWFLQSHLSSCVQASKHTAEEASASSAFFDELVPQNMTPWEIPTTEGTLVWEAGGPGVFGFRSPLLSPASHLKPQLQVALLPTRTLSSQSLDGCCLWMAFCCGLFPDPSFLVKMTAAFPMLSKHTSCLGSCTRDPLCSESYFRKLQLDQHTLGHCFVARNETWEFHGARQTELKIEFADRPPNTSSAFFEKLEPKGEVMRAGGQDMRV